ncbi:tripartite tricarboxylate transporter TctB family protein [Microvirga sp. VF16]|uniref:tripartite tricarboxylate transporter TctB family protein n=1 Tax=Microvirga sp. VF16 TaxID=2807101 RepID=UPI00193CA644|nr:tripartite tricarboxylate transporter TctB family protein [Microvirga sp. VF16]QRM35154.1 tripartite tricarboxylate transporter TctB family protein [Microvirga sp. VF16]
MALMNLSQRQGDIGFAAVLLAVAGWCFFESGNFPGASGTYPRVLSIMLAVGAALVILRALGRPAAADEPRLFIHPGRFLLAVAAMIAYVGAVAVVGYILPSIALGLGLPLLLGYRGFSLTVPVTLGTLAFIVLVFFVILARPLPADVLDSFLELLR